MMKKDKRDRREFLKATGAALVAASVPAIAVAQSGSDVADGRSRQQPIYLNGCGWNRDLPGVYGQACFVFEVRAEVGGTGVGTIRDDVYPEVNSQFRIDSVVRQRNHYTLSGMITASRSPELIGMLVRIEAESIGRGQGRELRSRSRAKATS